MVPSAGTLSPTFSSATTNYYLALTNLQTSIRFTPTASEAYATIRVGGVIVSSGSQSSVTSLSVDNTTFIINSTAQNGIAFTTYRVVVNRARCKIYTNNFYKSYIELYSQQLYKL